MKYGLSNTHEKIEEQKSAVKNFFVCFTINAIFYQVKKEIHIEYRVYCNTVYRIYV